MNIRMKFSKKGEICYIGHLDLMRYFQKVFRKTGFPISYSQGFHPHPIMSFAAPLAIGMASTGEYLDASVSETRSSEESIALLNEALIPDVRILDYRLLPDGAANAMAAMFAADYELTFPEDPDAFISLLLALPEFLAQDEIMIVKAKKDSDTKIDARPYVYRIGSSGNALRMRVAASSKMNIRPERLLEALAGFAGLDPAALKPQISRMEIYGEGMIPLAYYGDWIS